MRRKSGDGGGIPATGRAPGIEALLNRPGKPPVMDVERETLVEAAVATVGVGVFIALVMFIGTLFGAHETVDSGVSTTLGETGALALVAGMAVFIVLMGALGLWVTHRQEA